ncbi:hypothetical protein K2X40_02175 [Candidatus Babeliales bacterium]|nr:hypothetical protein [Candidatus Babeliales bacterium]
MNGIKFVHCFVMAIACFFGVAQGAASSFDSIDAIANELKKEKTKIAPNFEQGALAYLTSTTKGFFTTTLPTTKQTEFKTKIETYKTKLTTLQGAFSLATSEQEFREAINVITNLELIPNLTKYYKPSKETASITSADGKTTSQKLSEWIEKLRTVLQTGYTSRNETITKALAILLPSTTTTPPASPTLPSLSTASLPRPTTATAPLPTSSDSDSSSSSDSTSDNDSGTDDPDESSTESEEDTPSSPLSSPTPSPVRTPTPQPPAGPSVQEILDGYNADATAAIETIATELKKEIIENKDNFEDAAAQFLAANQDVGIKKAQRAFVDNLDGQKTLLTTHSTGGIFVTQTSQQQFKEAISIFLNLQKLTKLRQYYPALKDKVTVTTVTGGSKVENKDYTLSQWIKKLKVALDEQVYTSRNDTITRALSVTVQPTETSIKKKAVKRLQRAFRSHQARKKLERKKAKKARSTTQEAATAARQNAEHLQAAATASQQAADTAANALTAAQTDLAAKQKTRDDATTKLNEKDTALTAAQTALVEAKEKVTKAEKDLTNQPTGAPVAPPVIIGGTPLEQLGQSLTTLKSKLAYLAEALNALQTGTPIPIKTVDNTKALQDAVDAAKAAEKLAQTAVDTATQERTDAEQAQATAQAAVDTAQNAVTVAQEAHDTAAQKATDDKAAAVAAEAEAKKLATEAQDAKTKHKALKAKHTKPKAGTGPSTPPPTKEKKKKKKHEPKPGSKTFEGTGKKSHREGKKFKEEGDRTTSTTFDLKTEKTRVEQEIATRLAKAKELLAQAKSFTAVQDNDKVKGAIQEAQEAITEAEAQKTNRLALAGNARKKATKAKNLAENEQTKKSGAATTIQKTFRAFLERARLAAEKAEAAIKESATKKLESAKTALAQAKAFTNIQDDEKVKQAVEKAQIAIGTATDTGLGEDAQNFLDKTKIAKTAAKHALEVAKATQKTADEEAAKQAEEKKQAEKSTEESVLKDLTSANSTALTHTTKDRAGGAKGRRAPSRRAAPKPVQQATKTSDEEKQEITTAAETIVAQIKAIADGANTTIEIKALLEQANQKLASLHADDDVTGKQELLNGIKPLLSTAKIAAANEHTRQEQAAKIAAQQLAAAEELPKIVAEAKEYHDAMMNMKENFPKPLTKFNPAGKIVFLAIEAAQNLYGKLQLTQNTPKAPNAIKGLTAQKKALADLKKEFDKVVNEYTKAGGTPPAFPGTSGS